MLGGAEARSTAMLRRLFLDHPQAVGESYAEHLVTAGRFGLAMIAGGGACVIHAIVPAVFKTTGSSTVAELHRQMVAKRGAVKADQLQMKTVEFII
jgi:hypothetical protein